MCSRNETVAGGRLLQVNNGGRGRQESNRSEDIVGDICSTKHSECLRLITQNINGIGQTINNIKETGIKAFTHDYSVDILALQELNVCWNKIPYAQRVWYRFMAWR